MRIVIALALLSALFILGPLLIVVPMSFSTAKSFAFPPPDYWLGYYRAFFADIRWTQPVINSVLIALATMLLTMALVIPASFAMVRQRFLGRSAMNLLLMMPMIVPHIVMALGYYSYFGHLKIIHSPLGVVLAHTCLSVPVCYLIIAAALKGFDRNLERAAMNLGASPLRTFWEVTFPVLRPGFLVGGLFAFIHSFDEAVVAIFISGQAASTLPRKMFDSIRIEADPIVSVVSTLLFAAVLLAVLSPLLWRAISNTRRQVQSGTATA
ncbi:MAG: ABC transporter permease [Ferrovibrio sp.]|uniref:ABC transporter permease n=1 Tax=Ferrovibrio sp. TaxID=1917215 RepID=UPI00262FC421|nr:ABC transporter permease [Ferrovibrio sp.]MCW0234216.1 ABC transporter permease [Ferrovibrio sp.]